MIELLIEKIERHVRLTPEEHALFRTFWVEKQLDKGDYLLRNGEVCRWDSYVISGSLKAFYINPKSGKEEILYFAIDGWWATDMESFSKQIPSIYTIQALEFTRILQISHFSFNRMLEGIPALERFFRIILESYLGSLQRRIIYSHVLPANERYADFLEQYPRIAEKIPQYLIASYLGISAEFLSRMRKKFNHH